ncbi:MAG: DUF4422 domain-containing protein [Flavobacteriaceae bacterium]|nr:DUF4422 domain-containing protein [Flavobacteriaceae bacterium]
MTYSSNIKIYIFYYKKGEILDLNSTYQPLMCGNNLLLENSNIIGDDTSESISIKNKYYSELTGLYWIWKNTKQDIIGSCHYRRYFTAKPEPLLYELKRLLYYPLGLYKKRIGLIYTQNTSYFLSRILNDQEINKILLQYDAILPKARKLRYSIETHYRRYHDINDLKLLESIITEKYPDYLTAYHTVLKRNWLYANNMFIMKNDNFQEFMEWLFCILFEFEKKVDLSKYTAYQQRVFGFLAERLLNIWFEYKNLNYIELPLIYFKTLKKNN